MTNPLLTPKRPSKFEAIVNGVLGTAVRVTQVEYLTPRFQKLEIENITDKNLHGRLGDKLQIRVDAWTFRTFTPLPHALPAGTSVNIKRAQLVCFHHGAADSAAERCLHSLAVGDTFNVFGPRPSIALTELAGPLALFGDETSVAVAIALHAHDAEAPIVLESTAVDETREVLQRYGVSSATVIERTPEDAHLETVSARLSETQRKLVLTGKAQSIQGLRSLLGRDKQLIATTKAYWSVGKRGLD